MERDYRELLDFILKGLVVGEGPAEFTIRGFGKEELAEVSQILVEFSTRNGLDHCMDTTGFPSYVCIKLQRPGK